MLLQPIVWTLGCDLQQVLAKLAWPGPEDVEPMLFLVDRREGIEPQVMELLAGSLSSEEHRRMERHRHSADRERYLIGRGTIRHLLGAWLDRTPSALAIEAGPYGKPFLATTGGDEDVLKGGIPFPLPKFNISHSGDLVLIGLHASYEVGVDVECCEGVRDWEMIGRNLFPPPELPGDNELPQAQRRAAFIAAWCRFEAGSKARGDGVYSLTRHRPYPACVDTSSWDVAVRPGYMAAAAMLPRFRTH